MIPNYRSLAGHLRHNKDAAHEALRLRWHAWRSEYRGVLRCRKCGKTWEVTDKAQKDRKRCPSCQNLRDSMGKRAYEGMSVETFPDERRAVRGSKARWDGLRTRSVEWVPGDSLYEGIVQALAEGVPVREIMWTKSVTCKVVKAIGERAFGAEGYKSLMLQRKRDTSRENIRIAHAQYRALSPKEKARLMKSRFGGTCSLERALAVQLWDMGRKVHMNQWLSVPVSGEKVPREMDIKVEVGDGRKIAIFCDGEAFHGPGTIFGDPSERIKADRLTALAFFDLGYTSLRYSETEVHDGTAALHVQATLGRLGSCYKIYRNWYPLEERSV